MEISVIGLDIAKQVFQVHAADSCGRPIAQVKLRRAQVLQYFEALPPCLVGMEACATTHYWARELMVLGHEVRLMPPAYVKPYVKRNKTNATDAEAISKRGDRYIRHLLYVGAGNVIRYSRARTATGEQWIRALQDRRPPKVVIIALANKMARIAWALMARNESYRSPNAEAA